MLGLTILYRQTNSDYEKDEYSIDDLMQQLYIAKSILNFMDQLIPLVIDCTIVLRLINTLTLQAQPQDENDELLSLPIPTPFQERIETSHYLKCTKHNLILGNRQIKGNLFSILRWKTL